MDIVIEKMKDNDWPIVKSIYKEGIATGDATFESYSPDWEQWNKDWLYGWAMAGCHSFRTKK